MVMDRKLIGRLVEREVESRMSWPAFAQVSGVSRATLYRVRDGEPHVTQRVFRMIERALDMPFDSFTAVGVHDWATLRKAGLSEELVTWLMERAGDASSSVETALMMQRTHSMLASARVGAKGWVTTSRVPAGVVPSL